MKNSIEIRQAYGISQKDLADLIGCNRSSLAMAEKNKRNLKAQHREVLSAIENCVSNDGNQRVKQSKANLKLSNPALERQLRKNILKLRQLDISLASIKDKHKSVSALILFLDKLKDEKTIADTLEYKLKSRVANEKIKQLSIKMQNTLVEIASLKAAVKKIKSFNLS